jgi:hypothetical protein
MGGKASFDALAAAKKHLKEHHPKEDAKMRRGGSAAMIKAMFNQFFEVC